MCIKRIKRARKEEKKEKKDEEKYKQNLNPFFSLELAMCIHNVCTCAIILSMMRMV